MVKTMRQKYYYKVVRRGRFYNGVGYHSVVVTRGDIMLNYALGQVTKPTFGMIFAFTNKADALKWAEKRENTVVVKVKSSKAARVCCKVLRWPSLHSVEAMDKWWMGDSAGKVLLKKELSEGWRKMVTPFAEPPANTVLLHDVELIEEI